MTTTPNTTDTNTNTNANAPVVEADECDGWTGYGTRVDLCAPYITLEEARKERQEGELNKQRRAKVAISWKTRRSACTSARALLRRRRWTMRSGRWRSARAT